jgi:hypothetical protein
MSAAGGGTFRGTTPNKTIGRGKMPDFDYNSPSGSHIPRPKPDSTLGQSDAGSATTAASRQRQNQSKRDEVIACVLGMRTLHVRDRANHTIFMVSRPFAENWKQTLIRNATRCSALVTTAKLLPERYWP